jgi:hypothetical protein
MLSAIAEQLVAVEGPRLDPLTQAELKIVMCAVVRRCYDYPTFGIIDMLWSLVETISHSSQ